jgi:hypothetical protein
MNSLLQLSCYDIAEDFEFTVAMGPEASARFNAVLVDHTERTKLFMTGTLVPIEGIRTEQDGELSEHIQRKREGVERL